jgi:neutral ceramidase
MTMRIAAALGLVVLAACASSESSATPPLRAGASKVKITPEKMGWMTGYGNRNHRADGIKTDLYVRALVIEDEAGKRLVMVAADILGFPPDLSRAIRKEAVARFGIEASDLMLVASHTHGGPAIPQRPSMEIFHGLDETTGKEVYEYADWLQERVLESISKAMVARKPASALLTHAEAHFGMNRRFKNPNGSYSIKDNPEGTVDPEVTILRVADAEGKPVATVYTYACHGTTLGGETYLYHGDWIGYASDEIEKATGGAPALFATGCGADLNPTPRGPKFELAEMHGRTMAKAVAGAPAGKALSGPFTSALTTVELPLAAPPAKELLEKLSTDKSVYRQRHCKEMLKLMEAGKLPKAVPLPIQVWRLGDETVVAFGGETCVEYALRTKKELGAATTWAIGYANEVPCYIPSEKVLSESGYEPGWEPSTKDSIATGSMMFYGWPVPFAPGIEERILSATHRLAGR